MGGLLNGHLQKRYKAPQQITGVSKGAEGRDRLAAVLAGYFTPAVVSGFFAMPTG
jgi:hypothetical protein